MLSTKPCHRHETLGRGVLLAGPLGHDKKGTWFLETVSRLAFLSSTWLWMPESKPSCYLQLFNFRFAQGAQGFPHQLYLNICGRSAVAVFQLTVFPSWHGSPPAQVLHQTAPKKAGCFWASGGALMQYGCLKGHGPIRNAACSPTTSTDPIWPEFGVTEHSGDVQALEEARGIKGT